VKIGVVITAGGMGRRMGEPKQFLPLLGRPMVELTVEAFSKVSEITEIVLVVEPENFDRCKNYNVKLAKSGKERTDSVRNGLALLDKETDIVLIHDGARPLITKDIILEAIKQTEEFGAVVVGVPVKDTIKEIKDTELFVNKTLDRRMLWQAQTPQAFKYDIISKAYASAGESATDDSKLVEDLGIDVKMVLGSYENLKVTTPEDLIIAGEILKRRIGKV